MTGYRVGVRRTLRAAAHELRCEEFRVTRLSWFRRPEIPGPGPSGERVIATYTATGFFLEGR